MSETADKEQQERSEADIEWSDDQQESPNHKDDLAQEDSEGASQENKSNLDNAADHNPSTEDTMLEPNPWIRLSQHFAQPLQPSLPEFKIPSDSELKDTIQFIESVTGLKVGRDDPVLAILLLQLRFSFRKEAELLEKNQADYLKLKKENLAQLEALQNAYQKSKAESLEFQAASRKEYLDAMDTRLEKLNAHEQHLAQYRNTVLAEITTKANRDTWQIVGDTNKKLTALTYLLGSVGILQLFIIAKMFL